MARLKPRHSRLTPGLRPVSCSGSSRRTSSWDCLIRGLCPAFGSSCHELRIPDAGVTWRIIYRVDIDAIVIAEVLPKKQQATPVHVIRVSKERLLRYDTVVRGGG